MIHSESRQSSEIRAAAPWRLLATAVALLVSSLCAAPLVWEGRAIGSLAARTHPADRMRSRGPTLVGTAGTIRAHPGIDG